MAPPRRLLSVLGLTFGLAVIIGNVIGAGILRTPGDIAAGLPSFWPLIAVWIVGGVYALLGANALAELGAMTPKSGGQYVFVRRALGDYAAFVVGWSDWASTCGTTAAVAIVIAESALVLAPSLRSTGAFAAGLIVIFTALQWRGTRAGARIQDVTSVLKAVVLVMLIAICFARGDHAVTSDVRPIAGSLLVPFLLALQAVIYTYDGWTAIIYFSGEVKNPGRDIPRSMFGGLAIVIALYLLINVAFVRVIPIHAIAGQPLAAATVAGAIFGPRGDTIIRAILVAALLSAVNSNVLMAPRVVFAMADDGLFWRRAVEVNEGGTPTFALLASSALAIAFIVSGTFESVIAKLAFFFVANYALSFLSLFVLRRREPAAARPYLAKGHPLTTAIALLASVAFLIAAVAGDRTNSLWALALLAATVPAYWVVKRMRNRSKD